MADVQISDGRGGWVSLKLAEDAQGRPMFATSIPDLYRQSVQLEDASQVSMYRLPWINSTYTQPDLSDGIGKRMSVPASDPEAKRYYYADGIDASVSGQIGCGPETASIAKLANAGPLTGAFELGGNLYLVFGRIVALYNPVNATISQVADLGAGVTAYGGATFIREGTETADQSSTGTGGADTIVGPQSYIAQKVTPAASRDLGRVDIQAFRTDVVAVQQVTMNGSPTGGTFTLSYAGSPTAAIAYSADGPTLQAALRTLAGLSAVTVTKAGTTWTVTFSGVVGAALPLVPDGSALTGGTNPSVSVATTRYGSTVTGNVELVVMADYNGRPSLVDLAVASMASGGLPTSAGTVSFRFDDGDRYFQEAGVPFWLVFRAVGATTTATVGWTQGNAGTKNGLYSSDMGNSWIVEYDHYYATYSKATPSTAFVGRDEGSTLLYTSDGTTYTGDPTFQAKHPRMWGGLLVRDCRGSAAGAISWSWDGLNWSEPLLVGDPTIQVTALLALSSCVIVVKEDSVWAVDPSATAVGAEPVYFGGRSTANGPGAKVWRGDGYIPFDGKLMRVSGDLSAGFSVQQDVGPDVRAEMDAPFGTGRVVAVAGDRHCLYAAMSTDGSYKLYKSYEPEKGLWHGAIADLGAPSAFNLMHVYDQGGTSNPLLFYSTDSDNLGKIVCARTANPWADSAYRVNTLTNTLYHPWANGQAHTNPKAWLRVTATFAREAPGGYTEEMWDNLDGNGWRALENSRLYRTGATAMPVGLTSVLLKRATCLAAGSPTDYPILVTTGVQYAIRPPRGLIEFDFSVDAEDRLSAQRLGDLLGETALQIADVLLDAGLGSGTRMMRDPDGREHRVLFLNIAEQMIERRQGEKKAVITVKGVAGL